MLDINRLSIKIRMLTMDQYIISYVLWLFIIDASWINNNSLNQSISGGGKVIVRFVIVGATTDYLWDSAVQKWKVDKSNYDFISANHTYINDLGDMFYNSYSGTTSIPKFFRKIRNSGGTSGTIYTHYGVAHSVSSSFAIRCMKGS